MDPNYNYNQGVNPPESYNAVPPSQNMQGTNIWTGNYPNFQQMQQLNAQLGAMNLNNSGTNYLDAYMSMARNDPSAAANNGPYIIASVQPSPVTITQGTPGLSMPSNLPNNITGFPNGQFPAPSQANQVAGVMTPEQFALWTLQTNIALGNISQESLVNNLQSIPKGSVSVPITVASIVSQTSQEAVSPTTSVSSNSAPQTPSTPGARHLSEGAPGIGKPLQVQLNETGSTSSSSMPGSPSSISGHSLPETSTFCPLSPDSENVFLNGEWKSGNVPIRSHSLKYQVKYPKDKCYKCMKKIYPMDKMGPVKDAMYHKGCFVCKVCKTLLNVKNYYLNKNDTFDHDVYCKSHQPVGTGKGTDADAVLIKGLMNVPKLDKVNEQIRGDKNYHLDANAVEIAHARSVPAPDLQMANKVKEKAWTKDQRKSESVPPPNVVRYKDPVPEYDPESYERYVVENNPDY
ncbi:uncharacterized protein LOC134246445 [Saccostrea cucullata]|uniref:uncharacterized protein LOC134246445 n=1 Tax=Saccostrea cuccullata TaxID=36930 RepID=UPI002ED692BC